MIKLEPRNIDATNLLAQAKEKVDKRLSLDSKELDDVLCYAFANRHRDSINLVGSPKVTDALLNAGIIQRHSGKRNFTVHRDYVSHDAKWQAKTVEALFKFPLITKSGTYYTNTEDCLSLGWEDVSKINQRDAYLLKILDIEKTLAAWRDGHKPSVRFETIQYEKEDKDAAARFVAQLTSQAKLKSIPFIQIEDGFVVADCVRALGLLDATTTRFTGDATKKFAVVTQDKHGRQAIRPGTY